MGDRVSCTLTVLKEHQEQVEELLDGETGGPSMTTDDDDQGVVHLEFEEVNYGEIQSLNDVREAGIPYTWYWGRGGGFDAGYRHVRFTPKGEMRIIETSEENNAEMDLLDIKQLLADPTTLEQNLRVWVEENEVLPWDNQVEYGKCYLARQLITG